MVTRLIIARHGATFEENEPPRRVGLKTDISLSSIGRAQATKLGGYMKQRGLTPHAVYTSELSRTVETAQLACEAMGISRPIQRYDWFNEIDYGVDENQPEEAVKTRLGAEALNAWEEHGTPPQGWAVNPVDTIEKWRLFALHVARNHADQTVLVVTSNGVARFAPHLASNPDFVLGKARKMAVGALSVCLYAPDVNEWTLTSWNVKP